MLGLAEGRQMRTVEAGLRLLGGRPVIAEGAAMLGRALEAQPYGVIATSDAVDALTDEELGAVHVALRPRAPWLLVPGASDDRAPQAAIARVTGEPTTLTERASIEQLHLGHDPLLGPLRGLTLHERPRELPTVVPAGNDAPRALIGTPRGALVARYDRPRGAVFVSLAPIASLGAGDSLRAQFRSNDFLGVLPLLLFIKHALGDAGWRTPRARATFLIDDPNLRSMRYGCLDFDRLVLAAQRHDFHTAIAMIPIDHGKTRAPVAAFFRRHDRHLSLVMHGIDHLGPDLARPATPSAAEAKLVEGIRRMESHRHRTGVPYARAMTFPHHECEKVWMAAMSRVGFAAAVATPSHPWNPRGCGEDALYEMHPAELSYLGFPVINRFWVIDQRSRLDLLFDAWLGKPLVIWGHHDLFAGHETRAIDLARFLNERVAPSWQGIGAIHRGNYQTRTLNGATSVRVFSNEVVLDVEHRARPELVIKPGPAADVAESAWVDGRRLAPELVAGVGLVAACGPVRDIGFGPSRRPHVDSEPARVSRISRARRALTEARDRSTQISHHSAGRA